MDVPRRIVALVLPQLACELVRQRAAGAGPLAVILERHDELSTRGGRAAASSAMTGVLDAVDDEAWRLGVRPGQEATEAAALVSRLAIARVAEAEVLAALGRVAEIALAFGTTAAIALDDERSIDTVWLDVTGSAHLVGGEEALLEVLAERVAALGHRVRLALADGPRLAQAVARWAAPSRAGHVVPVGQGRRAMEPLPVRALPVDADVAMFLVRVGVMTVGDLVSLPRDAAHARLGRRAAVALDLALGCDAVPLVTYVPPRVLVEEVAFDEGVESSEALLFVARKMIGHLAARLGARGEACARLEVTIPYDRSIAALRAAAAARDEAAAHETAAHEAAFAIDLPAPLAGEADLFRALKAKLDQTELFAPAVALRLSIPHIARARRVQLDLSRDKAASPDALPTLLAELSAEIGPERVGVLEVVAAHRPEARSRLVPADPTIATDPTDAMGVVGSDAMPTRLLSTPVSLGRARTGAVVAVDRQLFSFDRSQFVLRLDGVEWWLEPVSRDYLRVLVTSADACGEAFVFVDRRSGEAFLQGWYE